jgi:hypothetical protein
MIDLTAVVGVSALSSRQISQLKEEWTLKTPLMNAYGYGCDLTASQDT